MEVPGRPAFKLCRACDAGEKETRAWTIRLGMTAPQAAGVIHTDFEKGFIRAETVAYQDFVEAGGYPEARQRGKLRLEGKEYVVSEADVLVRASPNWRYHMLGYDPCDVRQVDAPNSFWP